MERAYEKIVEKHLAKYRQMIFLSGPRQVGKTTTSLEASFLSPSHTYFNWDNENDRALIIDGPSIVAEKAKLLEVNLERPILVFDEIHKYKYWKRFLKGFFDTYERNAVSLLPVALA